MLCTFLARRRVRALELVCGGRRNQEDGRYVLGEYSYCCNGITVMKPSRAERHSAVLT